MKGCREDGDPGREAALRPNEVLKEPTRKTTDQRAFLERYRLYLAALTAEQQPEIDALCSRLSLQDRAISAIRAQPCPDLPPAA